MLMYRKIHLRYKIQLGQEWITQNIKYQFLPQKNLKNLAQEIRQTPDRRPEEGTFLRKRHWSQKTALITNSENIISQ